MWLLKRNSKPEEAPAAGPTITGDDDEVPVPDSDIGDLSSALAPTLMIKQSCQMTIYLMTTTCSMTYLPQI